MPESGTGRDSLAMSALGRQRLRHLQMSFHVRERSLRERADVGIPAFCALAEEALDRGVIAYPRIFHVHPVELLAGCAGKVARRGFVRGIEGLREEYRFLSGKGLKFPERLAVRVVHFAAQQFYFSARAFAPREVPVSIPARQACMALARNFRSVAETVVGLSPLAELALAVVGLGGSLWACKGTMNVIKVRQSALRMKDGMAASRSDGTQVGSSRLPFSNSDAKCKRTACGALCPVNPMPPPPVVNAAGKNYEAEEEIARRGTWTARSAKPGFQFVGGCLEDFPGELLVVHRAGHRHGAYQRG